MSFRYKINNRLGILEIYPLGEDDFTIEYSAPAKGKAGYKKELPSKVIFTGAAFYRMLKLEQSTYRCDYTDISVERKCINGATINWVPWFSSRISMSDGDWDLDRCKVEFSIDDQSQDKCFEDNKSNEIDILQSSLDRHIVRAYPADVVIETVQYDYSTSTIGAPCPIRYWNGSGTPEEGGWIDYYSSISTVNTPSFSCSTTTKWARQILVLDCDALPPGTDWIFLSESIGPPCTKTYVRPANLFDCSTTYNPTGFVQECSIVQNSDLEFKNGLFLNDIIELFVDRFCPSLTVKSDFLQINPDNESSVNYMTNARSKTRYVMVFQKSDVKRPYATQNATKATISFEKLMNAVTEIWNLQWKIEDGFFRIESPTYWPRNQGFDLTELKYLERVKGKNKYSYVVEDTPSSETYNFMDSSGPGDFNGLPIVYTGGCVSKNSKSNIKAHSVDVVTTDVELCMNNPEPDSKVVSDVGFVFMACDYDGGDYYIITEANILADEAHLNNAMGWAHLHRDYHRYNRALRFGEMNNQPTTFLSIIPTKKGTPITIPLCCGDVFNPEDYITGPFGTGIVSKAKFSFQQENIELELLYPSDEGLYDNSAPVAADITTHTYKNTHVDIDVTPYITDADPGSSISQVIAGDTIHGTVEIMPDNTVRYTPDPDYIGDDYIIYYVYDDWAQISNTAFIFVMVYDNNLPPIATNKTYSTHKDEELSKPAPGLFLGDTDEFGFSLFDFDAVSTEGGAVFVDVDGSFTYMPLAGFIGVDTFTYTIIDETAQTATATVTVNVLNPDAPVANDDVFATRKNQSLAVAAPGVLANDTTEIGTLTAVAETKATAHGGSVTIFTNGSFNYTPAAGYVGNDSFTYTADNGTDTDEGNVVINVLPNIYIRLSVVNDQFLNDGYTACVGGPYTSPNTSKKATFRLDFFSDAGAVTHMDVTGLGLKVNMKSSNLITTPLGSSTAINYATTGQLSGVSYNYLTDYRYSAKHYDCSGNIVKNDETITIEPGNYIII